MSLPRPEHQTAMFQLWKYVTSTAFLNLVFTNPTNAPNDPSNDSLQIEAYSDVDWGGDYLTRRSTSAYVFRLYGAAISWRSRLQRTVAQSSYEAEYMALKKAINEQAFIQSVLKELFFDTQSGIACKQLLTDNKSAIALAANPVHHGRTKHIDITYHRVREAHQQGETELRYVPTNDQLVDGLTKALGSDKWQRLLAELGMARIEAPDGN